MLDMQVWFSASGTGSENLRGVFDRIPSDRMEEHMSQMKEKSRCSGCGICSEVCPFKIIDVQKGSQATFRPERRHLCQRCGQCMAVCPSGFVQVEGLSYEDNFAGIRPFGFGEDEFADFLASRRSVRNFDRRDVPRDVVQKVVDAVRYAPFGSHPEKISMTIVDDRRTIESALPMVSEFLGRIVPMIENPLISFFIKKSSTPEVFNTVKNHLYPISKQGTYKLENGDRITRGAPVLILFHSDTAAEARTANTLINATYAMLQAHALGLGAAMVEVVPAAVNQVKGLKELFQIPEKHEVGMSLILGYPKYKYRRAISRPVPAANWI